MINFKLINMLKVRTIHIAVALGILMSILFLIRLYLLHPPEDTLLSNGTRLEWRDCTFDIPLTEIIHCATLYPSLQNKEKNVTLPIVVVKNIGLENHTDPVLYIQGGPGAATGFKDNDIEYWLDNINELNYDRDFILYDQRGTGESTPEIICPSFQDFNYDALTTDLSLKEEMLNFYNKHKECRYRIEEFDGDLTGYSTKYNTQDVLDITHALNYSQWNLYGVSYGTRVALEVMRTKPTHIRSIILDSVFPSDKHDLLTWPAILNNAIQMIFERCENDKDCHASYPDLRELFKVALRKLKYNSLYVHMPGYYSDGELDIYLNDSRFIDALFFAIYDSELISLIPDAINDVANGKQKSLIPIATAYADSYFDEYSNIVTFNSVICNDENMISREKYEVEVARYPMLKSYTAGLWEYDICRIWKSNNISALKIEPVKSLIPTLILAGRDDGVTPWQWGKEVHDALKNSFYFVFSNTTHGVIGNNTCATKMSYHFLEKLKVLKNDCL